jgi:hypothetical protein
MLSPFVWDAYDLKISENKVLREMSEVKNGESCEEELLIHTVLLLLFRLLSLHISYAVCKLDTFWEVISEYFNVRTIVLD